MLKLIYRLIFTICILTISNQITFAKTMDFKNFSDLTIQIGNLSLKTHLPRHDFAYEMTISDEELYTGDPLQGQLSYDHMDVRTVFSRYDYNSIDVNLKITDPALGNRIIWKGKVSYHVDDKVESIPEIVDDLHYRIFINLIQPSQGRPQFIIGIVSY